MKYAISATSDNINSNVDTRFGRASFFVLYDTENESYSWLKNEQNFQATQGAGIQTAQNIIAHQPDAVVSGHCGPKAFRVLSKAGIQVFTINGSVTLSEAFELIKSGKLSPLQEANVEGHWG